MAGIILGAGACSSPRAPTANALTLPVAEGGPVIKGTSTRRADSGEVTHAESSAATWLESFGLQDVLARVLEHNPNVEMARGRISQAQAAFEQSRIAFKPQVSLDLSYTVADAPSVYLFKTIDGRGFAPGVDFNDPATLRTVEPGIGVGYNLYSGGRHRLAGEQARLQEASAYSRLDALNNRLTASVFDLWFAAQMAGEQREVAELSFKTLNAQLEETRALHEEGSVLRSDVLSIQVRLAEAQERILRAVNAQGHARIGLGALMGFADLRLDQLRIGDAVTLGLDLPEELGDAIAGALQRRPELAQVRALIQHSELQLDAIAASALPQIDLYGRTWANGSDSDFDQSEPNWSVGIAARFDLFDGGARRAQIHGVRAQLMQLQGQQRALHAGIRQDVEQAFMRREEARSRLVVAASAVELALESLRLVNAQYASGAATITRFLTAEQMATQAQRRLSQAAGDGKRASAALARAMGLLTSR